MKENRFIILGKDYDYLKEAFDVYNERTYMRYITNPLEGCSRLHSLLHRIAKKTRIKKLIAWVNAKYIYPNILCTESADNNKKTYLLVSTDWWGFLEGGFADYFKENCTNGHIIAYFTDNATKYTWIDVDNIWWSDWTITFNPKDCIEKGWGFFMDVNTKIHKDLPLNRVAYESDVFFCGCARNRLGELHRCYTVLNGMGLNCEFYIADVPEDLQLVNSGIIYNQRLTYKEVQRKSALTRCILEISDMDADGFTYRVEEAMMYDTKVITNVDFIRHTDWYNPDMIMCINDASEISKEWIMKEVNSSFNYDDDLSVDELFKLIDNHFSDKHAYPCTKWQRHSDEYIHQLCNR